MLLFFVRKGDSMNTPRLRSSNRKIRIKDNREIHELAEKYHVKVDVESIQKIFDLGVKCPYTERQLAEKLNELENEKKNLESSLRKIAKDPSNLESTYAGLRWQVNRIFLDNRVRVFHLSAHSPTDEHGKRLRNELIKKYVQYSQST